MTCTIPGYDREPGYDLTRSRYRPGTKYFERYLTVHRQRCNAPHGHRRAYLKTSDSVPEAVDAILRTMLDWGIKVRPVLPDRGFFSMG